MRKKDKFGLVTALQSKLVDKTVTEAKMDVAVNLYIKDVASLEQSATIAGVSLPSQEGCKAPGPPASSSSNLRARNDDLCAPFREVFV